MAIRNMLPIGKLEEFKRFLEDRGYLLIPTMGVWEVIRAKKGKEQVIVYCKKDAKEHLSISDKDFYLVQEFLKGSRDEKQYKS